MSIKRFVDAFLVDILLHISKKGRSRYKEFLAYSSSRGVVHRGIKALLREGLIAKDDEGFYICTAKGERIAALLLNLRRAYYEGEEGGQG